MSGAITSHEKTSEPPTTKARARQLRGVLPAARGTWMTTAAAATSNRAETTPPTRASGRTTGFLERSPIPSSGAPTATNSSCPSRAARAASATRSLSTPLRDAWNEFGRNSSKSPASSICAANLMATSSNRPAKPSAS
eukprot:Amastigsp_a2218_16.p2 type:complete len:138 gc:universal Amastigsp_a2218_16:647-234(-)